MAQSTHNGDLFVAGNLGARTMSIPAGTISNDAVAAGAAIAATKLEHQFALYYQQAVGSNVAAATVGLHVCRGTTGEIVSVEAALIGQVPDGNRTAVVDLKKSTGGGAFASVLAAAITLDSANTIRVAEAGTVSSADLVDGDILQIAVTLGGDADLHPQGLIVTVNLREDPA